MQSDIYSESTKHSEFGATSKSEYSTEFIEIVFGKKDLKEEEIKEIIKEYTDGKEFVIVNFETIEGFGMTRVIIKFVDREAAEGFYVRVTESSATNKLIVRLGFISGIPLSSCSVLFPHLFYFIFVNLF